MAPERWSAPRPTRPAGALLLLASLVACRRETPDADTVARVPPSAAAAPSTESRAAASSSASVAPAAAPAPSPPVTECKAIGRKSPVSLGSLRDDRVRLLAENGYLYVLGYTEALARVRWLRVSRAGGQLETVAEQTGLGEPSDPTIHDGAAYYTRAGKLFRLGPEPSASAPLHSAADSPVALHAGRAFFVDCDRPGKSDRVVELPLAGGEPRTIAELLHRPGKRCQYSSVAADAREVLIADWNEQRIVAVSRESGATRDLVRKRGFVQELMLEDGAVSFVSTRGVERTDRNGQNAKVLIDPERVVGPYSTARLRAGSYWLVDNIPYTLVTRLYRVPYEGGPAETLVSLKTADPIMSKPGDDWLLGYAIDDQCVYLARQRYGQPIELVARPL